MADAKDQGPDVQPEGEYLHGDSKTASRFFASRKSEQQAAFFLPHLHPGMTVLDCGCGPGSITAGLAAVVAPAQVVGIDLDAKSIESAQASAEEHRIPNVQFKIGSVYELPFPDDSFHAVFSNGVLQHLQSPAVALAEIYRVLRPGGVAGIRSPDFEGHLLAPPEPLLIRIWELAARLLESKGCNPFIGKHQRALLREVGFVKVEASASYECYGSDEAVQTWSQFMSDAVLEEGHSSQLKDQGLADAEDLKSISEAYREWGNNPDAFFADAWCEAVGWKVGSTED